MECNKCNTPQEGEDQVVCTECAKDVPEVKPEPAQQGNYYHIYPPNRYHGD